ncbi:MAG: hypothetical protein JW735_09155 [Prolixibacteraceae bacterium]|nr:hypothetical protein [Prolixibacteraceae bacterium]
METVYFDELFIFTRLINRRKITEYKMQLAIISNPHTKTPKTLWHMLDQRERENEGKAYIDAEFDPKTFEAFKETVKRHGSAIDVK